MEKIEHIGIAVKDLQVSIKIYEKLLNVKCYKTELVESENVNTAFFKTGESKIELLEGINENSVIKKYVEKNGEGMHHIAFAVNDLKSEMHRLKNEGFRLLNEEPKFGADNKLVCFIHPKDCSSVLIELVQDRN